MYSDKQQKKYIDQTSKLLKLSEKKNFNKEEATEVVNNLQEVISFHDYRYYVLTDPTASDYEYDTLYKFLRRLEEQYPDLVSKNSPTQRIPEGLTKDFPEVEHLVAMLSLDNSYNEDDLVDFDRRVRDITGLSKVTYAVEPKFDGSGISLIYENDKLVRGASRGNGAVGEDITPNIRVLRSIPLSPSFSLQGIRKIELRGEVMINKRHFKQINEERMSEGKTPFANPRNSAAGSLRLQDAKEVAKRGLEAFIYDISYAEDESGNNLIGDKITNREQNTALLHKLGFKAPFNELETFDDIKDVLQYCEEWEEKRDDYGYEIDGMVIKVNDLGLQEKLGFTAHHPRWAMAYKFKARQATSTIRDVVFQVGRVGSITPVAKIEPVNIGGATVSSVSLFNEDFVNEKDLHIGDKVLVERAGDVIPYIVKPVKDARNGNEKKIVYPKNCPSCNTELVRPEGEAVWQCTNINCPAQVLERMIHFVSKDAMDIEGFGTSLVQRFYEEGYIKRIPDIYRLDYDKIRQLERFGEKSTENLQAAIDKSKDQGVSRLLFGLGIRFVGKTTAKVLAKQIKCIGDLKDWDKEKLESVRDIGPKVAGSIADFFDNEENLSLIEELGELEVSLCEEESEEIKSLALDGKTFVFTGSLENFTRDSSKDAVEKHGGSVTGSVSSKTDYLVVGEKPGSKLDKAKKLGTVEVLDEEAFIKMLDEIQ